MSRRASSTFLQAPSFSLNLVAADAISNAAIAAVETLADPRPVCVTVLDSHGGLLVQKRMDGCPDGAYVRFSYAKARTCIHLQTSSRQMRLKYTGPASDGTLADPAKFTQAATMATIVPGELIPVAGGVLIQCQDDDTTDSGATSSCITIGAVGVSGAAADEDEYLAIQGVVQGLVKNGNLGDTKITTVPPEHCCTTLKK
ncbi:hypothetical protein ACA910_014669 [Epithemia clementina (nom. ined.)]